MQPREHRLADPRGVVDRGATQLTHQDFLHPVADRRGVAVTGQVDQAGEIPAVRFAPDEEADLPALLEVGHLLHGPGQVVDPGLEQLIAGKRVENVHDRLAAVAAVLVAGAPQDLGGLVPQQRDPADRLRVGRGGEQPEEPTLADDPAVGVELAEAEVVKVRRAVDPRLVVVLGDHHEVLPGALDRLLRQGVEGAGSVPVGPQHAEAGPGHRDERLGAVVVDELVLPVAEEGEVVIDEPLQQLPGARRFFSPTGHQARVVEQPDGLVCPGPHLRPVRYSLLGEPQDLDETGLQVLDEFWTGRPFRPDGWQHLDVHPRLGDDSGVGLRLIGGEDRAASCRRRRAGRGTGDGRSPGCSSPGGASPW